MCQKRRGGGDKSSRGGRRQRGVQLLREVRPKQAETERDTSRNPYMRCRSCNLLFDLDLLMTFINTAQGGHRKEESAAGHSILGCERNADRRCNTQTQCHTITPKAKRSQPQPITAHALKIEPVRRPLLRQLLLSRSLLPHPGWCRIITSASNS